MKSNNLINAWKNADANAQVETPVADAQVNESLMTQIVGGANSAGYRCTVSGDCNGSGRSCWTAGGAIDQIFTWI